MKACSILTEYSLERVAAYRSHNDHSSLISTKADPKCAASSPLVRNGEISTVFQLRGMPQQKHSANT